jgi:uncharacterized C2H2 Zn-finger protein
VVQHFHIPDLFPRHWHVLQEFHNSMRHVFQSTVIKYNAGKQKLKVIKVKSCKKNYL